jgi:CHAT domain-containing protein
VREGATADLLARERKLRGLIRAQVQYNWKLQLNNADATEIGEAKAEMAKLNVEYETIQSQLRDQNPHLASLARFTPLTLKQIQEELHDGNTLLLQYALGKEQSYLWAVTSNSFESYELPPGETIENAAREVYRLITARQRSDGTANRDYQVEIKTSDDLLADKTKSLSQMLFGPVAEQLGNRRLLLVTDGALRYVPFDALPVPLASSIAPASESASRLTFVDRHEIVEAASMSTLVAIRNARTANSSPSKVVAVLADPVFSRNDDRVQLGDLYSAKVQDVSYQTSKEPITRSIDEELRGGFARLVHASEEADAISAAAPRGTSFVAKGFDASRETAMSPAIGEYQILHFATHGLLDSQHPEMSGIVLTMVDRNGAEKNGLMPLYDIYSLELSAELTVLSACQTALGKDVKGEGFVGLTHSFISAGSKSVIASLWKVDDRATAALMAQLYESMLQKGMTPSAALRAAKLEVKRQPQWNAPYFWAGFVLQGDYTNRISVESHSWVYACIVLLSFLVLVSLVLIVFRKRLRWPQTRQSN